jgi:Arc/MetJ-type ribon-helix-helix transcriptional regulator
MPSAQRKVRSYSLDPSLLVEVERTKGRGSASERVNQLLRLALEVERKQKLAHEACEFFAQAPADREERRAFQKAGLQSWGRE